MGSASLQDMKIHVKLKLSALWAAVMFCYIYGDYFGLYVPNQLSGMLAGQGPIGPTSRVFGGHCRSDGYPGRHGLPFDSNAAKVESMGKHCSRRDLYGDHAAYDAGGLDLLHRPRRHRSRAYHACRLVRMALAKATHGLMLAESASSGLRHHLPITCA